MQIIPQWDVTTHLSEWQNKKVTNTKGWPGWGDIGSLTHYWLESETVVTLKNILAASSYKTNHAITT